MFPKWQHLPIRNAVACIIVSHCNACCERCSSISFQIICNRVNSQLEQWSHRNRCHLMTSGHFIPLTRYLDNHIECYCASCIRCEHSHTLTFHSPEIPAMHIQMWMWISKSQTEVRRTFSEKWLKVICAKCQRMVQTHCLDMYGFHETFKPIQTDIHAVHR